MSAGLDLGVLLSTTRLLLALPLAQTHTTVWLLVHWVAEIHDERGEEGGGMVRIEDEGRTQQRGTS